MTQQNQPGHNPGVTFLGLTGGLLALAITVLILFPIVCCVGMALAGAIGGTPTTEVSP